MRVNERLVSVYVSKNDEGYRICDITKDLIPLYNKYLTIIVGPFGAITDNICRYPFEEIYRVSLSQLQSKTLEEIFSLLPAFSNYESINIKMSYQEEKELNKQLLENPPKQNKTKASKEPVSIGSNSKENIKIKELEQKIDELQKAILEGSMFVTEPEYLTPKYAKNHLHEMIKTNFFIRLIKEKHEELGTLKSWQFRKIKLAKAYIIWYSKNLAETYYEVKKYKGEERK